MGEKGAVKRRSAQLRWYWALLLAGWGLLAVPVALGASGHQAEQELRTSIFLLDKAVRNASALAGDTRLGAAHEREMRAFALYLQTRIAELCIELRELAGAESVLQLPCPSTAGGFPMRPDLPSAVLTPEEEIQALDRRLTAAVGDFDEMLLTEEQRVAEKRSAKRSGGQGDRGGQDSEVTEGTAEGGDDEEGQPGAGQEQAERTASPPEQRQVADTAQAGAASGRDQGGRVAGRERLAVDEDIVARQLREAAEKETDPQLREKLWQEYRRYTGKDR